MEVGRTHRLRFFLDSRYPLIIEESQSLLARGFPDNRVARISMYGGTMTVLSLYSRHLPCLFPQHGPGPKHERPIQLEHWQQRIVDHHPWPLLRGLIRSDGCSFINRTGPYEYLSYHFSNRSTEIVEIFEAACRNVGILHRKVLNQSRELWEIRINRRGCVAMLKEHVGIKR